ERVAVSRFPALTTLGTTNMSHETPPEMPPHPREDALVIDQPDSGSRPSERRAAVAPPSSYGDDATATSAAPGVGLQFAVGERLSSSHLSMSSGSKRS